MKFEEAKGIDDFCADETRPSSVEIDSTEIMEKSKFLVKLSFLGHEIASVHSRSSSTSPTSYYSRPRIPGVAPRLSANISASLSVSQSLRDEVTCCFNVPRRHPFPFS